MTDRFDPKNAEHAAIKKGIEIGDGIEAACVFMHSYLQLSSFVEQL